MKINKTELLWLLDATTRRLVELESWNQVNESFEIGQKIKKKILKQIEGDKKDENM